MVQKMVWNPNTRVQFWLVYLPDKWPWASHLPSLSLSFLLYKMGLVLVLASLGCHGE